MNANQLNLDDFILLDDVYEKFNNDIDYLPMILAKSNIEVVEIDSLEYIEKKDCKKIENTIYLKRHSTEIIINNTKEESSLINYKVL